jgi:hypothetical protein
VLLSGYYLGANWKKMKIYLKIIFILLAAMTIFNAVRLNYFSSYDTNELAVYVQTPEQASQIIQKAASDCEGAGDKCIYIDQSITWPLSWYFRNSSTLYPTGKIEYTDSTKYIFVPSDNFNLSDVPAKFSSEKFYLRDWWVPTACQKLDCDEDFFRYYFFRQTWSGKGGFEAYILERK